MGGEQIKDLLYSSGTKIQTRIIGDLVDMFIQSNIDEELSPETIRTRKSHLKQFSFFCQSIGEYDMTIINNAFLEQYFIYYRHGHQLMKSHGKSTTNTSKRIMKVFLTWLRDYKEMEIRANPENLKSTKDKHKNPKAIDSSIIKKVIDECTDYQDKLIISVFIETGIRISELVKIKTADIKGDTIEIHGKGDIDRTVTMTDLLASALKKFAEEKERKEDDYLFQNERKNTGKFSISTVRKHVKKWFLEIAGIDVHPHQLRHSFAVGLLLSGCDLVTIQKLLGHEDINTTMIYLRVTDLQVKEKYKLFIGKSFMA